MNRTIAILLLALALACAGCSELREDPAVAPTSGEGIAPVEEATLVCDALPGPGGKSLADLTNVAVILVHFHDSPPGDLFDQADVDEIDDFMFSGPGSIDDLYREMSFLQQSVGGTVIGPIALEDHSYLEPCEYHDDLDGDGSRNYRLWNEEARARADALYDMSSFGAEIYVYPQSTECFTDIYGSLDRIGGWAAVGGDVATMYIWGAPVNWAHELGHLAGFGHSWIGGFNGGNDWPCLMSPSSYRYGNYVPMRQVGGPWKSKAGWYDPARVLRIEDSGSHTIHVAPSGRPAGDIVDPPTGTAYQYVTLNPGGTAVDGDEIHISFRRPEGAFDSDPYFDEVYDLVYVHRGASYQSHRQAILDGDDGDGDEAGAAFHGEFCTVTVQPGGIGTDYATVEVVLSEPVPTLALDPSLQTIGAHTPGVAACHFDLTITNNGAPGSPDVTYGLQTTAGAGYHVVPKLDQVTVAPGDSHTQKVAFVPEVVLDSAPYFFTVTATDVMGNQGPAHVNGGVRVDVDPPAVPSDVAAEANCTSVDLAWTEVEDAVLYEIRRDGAPVGDTDVPSWSEGGLVYDTDYVYSVRAVDDLGNASAWSPDLAVSTACGEGVTTSVAQPVIYVTRVRPGTWVSRSFDVQVGNLDDAGCEPVVDIVSSRVSGPSFTAMPEQPTGVTVPPGGTRTAHPSAFLGTDPVDGVYVMRTDFLNEVDPGGVSASETLTVVVDREDPSAPTGLDAVLVSATTAQLTWNAATDNAAGVAYYRIERNGQVIDTTTGTSYTDPNVSLTVRWEYRVQAVDHAGHDGAWSNSDFVGCAKCPTPVEL